MVDSAETTAAAVADALVAKGMSNETSGGVIHALLRHRLA